MNNVWLSTSLWLLAINGNCGTQQEFSVSIKISKEIVPFQQARVSLGMQCIKLFSWTSIAEAR